MKTYSHLLSILHKRRIKLKRTSLESDEYSRVLAAVRVAEKNLAEFAQVQKSDLKSSYEKMRLQAKYAGQTFVSPQQDKLALDIVAEFNAKKILVTLIAEPQWGKTGTILTTAYYMCSRGADKDLTDPSQVYIITGMSDTDWEEQTRARMIPQFENVFHRAHINSIVPDLAVASNALIIIDECHYASRHDQTLKLALENAGLLDIHRLTKKNIRIIQTSATPDNVLLDSHSWGEYHAMVTPTHKSATYTSFADLLESDRLLESLDLTDPCEAETLFQVARRFAEPRYHIVRIPRQGSKGNREAIVDNLEAFCYDHGIILLFHDSSTKIKDIDKLLATVPKRHTMIIITDYWRAAKTLNDKFVGVVHERVVQKPNSTTVVQSLAGRMVGHDRQTVNGPIIFTYLNAVKQYIQLANTSYSYTDTKYHSTGVHSDGQGKLTVKDSYAHECVGITHKYIDSTPNKYGWRLFFGKDPRKQAAEFVREHLGTELPKKKQNADGFYVQNDVKDPLYRYSKYFRNDQPYNKRIFKGLSGNNAKKTTNWRQYALYRDPTNPKTLIWFVCWRKRIFPEAPSDVGSCAPHDP